MSVYWIDCFLCKLDLVINVLSNQIVLNCGHIMMNNVSQTCSILLQIVQKCSEYTEKKVLVGPGPILLNFIQKFKNVRNTKKSIVVPGQSCSKMLGILKKVLVDPGQSCSILLKIA